MEELGVTTREDPIDLEVFDPRLELGAELGAQGQALFFAGEIHDVFARRPSSRLRLWAVRKACALLLVQVIAYFSSVSAELSRPAGASDVLGELTG
jgi:hypothetical protein